VEAPFPYVLDDPVERERNLRSSMEEAIERLATELSEGHTQGFKEVLAFYSRFWTYSVRNSLLIQLQCPQATRCGGRYLWNQLGYHIERGQKAIWIWAPILGRTVDPQSGEEVKTVTGFRPAPVFDFSQLQERETRPMPQLLPAQPDDMESEFQRCLAKVRASGIEVKLVTMPAGTDGSSSGGTIKINQALDSRSRLLVLFHELVHEIWHASDFDSVDKTRQQKEFEAEAVAFVTAAAMGLSHPSARDYLLHWRATPGQLQTSLLIIQRMVRKLLVLLEIPFDVPHTAEALVA
jgi:hypothetical protein